MIIDSHRPLGGHIGNAARRDVAALARDPDAHDATGRLGGREGLIEGGIDGCARGGRKGRVVGREGGRRKEQKKESTDDGRQSTASSGREGRHFRSVNAERGMRKWEVGLRKADNQNFTTIERRGDEARWPALPQWSGE